MNNNFLRTIKSFFYLDKLSWIFLVLIVIGNGLLWYIWVNKIHFSQTAMFYSTAVAVTNIVLSFLLSRKDPFVPYFLLGVAILVQVFILVLLKNTTLVIF